MFLYDGCQLKKYSHYAIRNSEHILNENNNLVGGKAFRRYSVLH